MTKIFKSYLFLCLAGITLYPACIQPGTPERFTNAEVRELDSFLLNIPKALPIPGIAIAVIKDNKVYYNAVGKTTAAGKNLTDSTLFFTGNLSEPMIATAMAKLAEMEKISLDDPVMKHLPYFELGDPSYRKITIRHLLTHTSGVPHHSAVWDMPYNESDALRNTTRSIHLQQPLFKPAGSKVRRTPYNYDILADLIANVSKMPFEEFMQKNVLEALDMKASTYVKANIDSGITAQPHRIDNWLTYEMQREELYPYNREHVGSIGFHSSTKDMSSWMYMLLNNGHTPKDRFLQNNVHEELMAAQFKTKNNSFVGMGWEIENDGKNNVYSKRHQLGGFSADIKLIPEKNIGILVLANIAGDFDPKIISDKINRWLDGKSLIPVKTPVNVPMGKKLAYTNNLDSALEFYSMLHKTNPAQYNFSEEALSQLGINLFYRLDRKPEALRVFEFCATTYPTSSYAHLNLAEACMLQKDTVHARRALARVKDLPLNKPDMLPRLVYLEEMLKKLSSEPN